MVKKDRCGKLDTLIGVNDTQLKTPEHDKLCIWVDTNFKNIMNQILITDKDYFTEDIYDHNLPTDQNTSVPVKVKSYRTLENTRLDWEEPIKGNNGFVIGIPDFRYVLEITEHREVITKPYTDREQTDKIGIVGFIEVKPVIKSIGETMRQLKLYRSYFPSGVMNESVKRYTTQRFKTFFPVRHIQWCLVTNDPTYRDIFEKQGIKYIVPADMEGKT